LLFLPQKEVQVEFLRRWVMICLCLPFIFSEGIVLTVL
jgi:hypothetical protein